MTPDAALDALRDRASDDERAALARYGIPDTHALGVAMRDIKALAKAAGRDHALALALWRSGLYEARTLAAFVADPARTDAALMDAWAADFDTWAICDTVCFHLFDRTEAAWSRVAPWAAAPALYTRRAAFALVWGLSVHDKTAEDARFADCLDRIEAAMHDREDHVRKGASMALRATGKRSGPLNDAARAIASRLAASATGTVASLGRAALRDLDSPATRKRLAAR